MGAWGKFWSWIEKRIDGVRYDATNEGFLPDVRHTDRIKAIRNSHEDLLIESEQDEKKAWAEFDLSSRIKALHDAIDEFRKSVDALHQKLYSLRNTKTTIKYKDMKIIKNLLENINRLTIKLPKKDPEYSDTLNALEAINTLFRTAPPGWKTIQDMMVLSSGIIANLTRMKKKVK